MSRPWRAARSGPRALGPMCPGRAVTAPTRLARDSRGALAGCDWLLPRHRRTFAGRPSCTRNPVALTRSPAAARREARAWLSYARRNGSGFGGRELAIQRFDLLGRCRPALESRIQLALGPFGLLAEPLCFLDARVTRVHSRIFERRTYRGDLA